jgi:hypothetical protein
LTEPTRVPLGLVRAASAFLSTLAQRPACRDEAWFDKPGRDEPGPVSLRAPELPEAPHALPTTISPGFVSPESISSRLIPEGSSTAGIDNKCPVCQARFRGSHICSRCGADLEPLMVLTVKAWRLRQAARQALDAGDVGQAMSLAIEAQSTQYTDSGEALRLLAAWLQTVPPSPSS